jgi:hypothetical protein
MGVTRTSVSTTLAAGTAGITVAFGTGATAGEAALLLIETAGQNLPSTPTGFTLLDSLSTTGTPGAAGITKGFVYYKASISSTDISGGIAVGDSGDHTDATLITFSGCDATTPFITSGFTGASVAQTSFTTNSIAQANLTANDLVLACFFTDRDSATAATNSSPSWGGQAGSNAFIFNQSTASGAGGGIIVNQLTPSGAPTGGVFFSMTTTSSIWAGVTIGVKAAVAAARKQYGYAFLLG